MLRIGVDSVFEDYPDAALGLSSDGPGFASHSCWSQHSGWSRIALTSRWT